MKYVMGITFFVLLFFVGMVLLIGGLGWLNNQMMLPGQLAKIEQLRADAANVDPQQAEDVIGQVTEWNRIIVSNQTYNNVWWAGWAVPDEWESVQTIEVPQ